jgi:hypothetical protein
MHFRGLGEVQFTMSYLNAPFPNFAGNFLRLGPLERRSQGTASGIAKSLNKNSFSLLLPAYKLCG